MKLDVPVEPGIDDARDLLVRELADPVYREAEPNWFDQLASNFWDWLTSLFEDGIGGSPSLLWGLVILVVLTALVAAYFIFGPPRLNRRSTITGALFGEDDGRDAARIRTAAEAAAAAEDWPLAIEEMFRSVARGLAERAILTPSPGTTASGFALRAREFFPGEEHELAASAIAFDDVRYLDRAGTRTAFEQVSELERTLRNRTPVFETAGSSA